MAEARERIYVDDATGQQIASPEDAKNGGAVTYVGDDAERWRKANPGKSLSEKPAGKAAARPEDKAVPGPERKGA